MKSSNNDSKKTAISRRDFIKKGGTVAAVAGAGLLAWQSGLLSSIFGDSGGHTPPELSWSTSKFVAMGTFLHITTPKDGGPGPVRKGVAAVKQVEDGLSCFLAHSEVGQFNRQARQGEPVVISRDFASVWEAGEKIHRHSGGAFDPTVAPLLRVWGFRDGQRQTNPTRFPTDRELQEAMDRVGMENLRVASDKGTLMVGRDQMELDLGGIGKGYGMDMAARALADGGVNGMVNGGGDIATAGWAEGGEPWVVGIRDPLRPGRIFATLQLPGGQAVATSGNYEQFLQINGERISHIIDPRTGAPANRVVSATVVADRAVDADAIATACTVMDPVEAMEMCEGLPRVEAFLVYKANSKGTNLSTAKTKGMDLKVHYRV